MPTPLNISQALEELTAALGPNAVFAEADVPLRNRNDYSGLLPTQPVSYTHLTLPTTPYV